MIPALRCPRIAKTTKFRYSVTTNFLKTCVYLCLFNLKLITEVFYGKYNNKLVIELIILLSCHF